MNFVNKGLVNPLSKFFKNQTVGVYKSSGRQTLPTSVDWRTKGIIGSIKNQGKCGSCWAFSTVSSLESFYSLKYKQNKTFSEQQLVDCVYTSRDISQDGPDGCQGS